MKHFILSKRRILYCFLPLLYLTYFVIIYLLFLTKSYSNYSAFCFMITITATLFALIYTFQNVDSKLVSLAFLCISISDLILIFHIEYRTIALIPFSIAQLLFGYRFSKTISNLPILWNGLVRLLLLILSELIGIIILKSNFDITIFLTLFYFSNLVINFVLSCITLKKDWRNPLLWMLVIGFLCFICCDVCVGLNASSGYLEIKEESLLYQLLNGNLALEWLFYIPTLFILSFSTLITISKKQNVLDK